MTETYVTGWESTQVAAINNVVEELWNETFPQDKVAADIAHALWVADLPDVQWDHEDDLCDCIYQRIGMWKNPYLATQHEIRLCCIWEKLYQLDPSAVRTIPGYWNDDVQEWQTEPRPWDGETDMPMSLWVRQIARQEGITVQEARSRCALNLSGRPRGIPREQPVEEPSIDPMEAILEVVYQLQSRVDVLEAGS